MCCWPKSYQTLLDLKINPQLLNEATSCTFSHSMNKDIVVHLELDLQVIQNYNERRLIQKVFRVEICFARL